MKLQEIYEELKGGALIHREKWKAGIEVCMCDIGDHPKDALRANAAYNEDMYILIDGEKKTWQCTIEDSLADDWVIV